MVIQYKTDTRLLGALLICVSPVLILTQHFQLNPQKQIPMPAAVLFFLGFFAWGLLMLTYRRVLLDESSRQVELIHWRPLRKTHKKLAFDKIDSVAIGPETTDPFNNRSPIPVRYLFLECQNSLEEITYLPMSEPNAARREAEKIADRIGGVPVRFVSGLELEVANERPMDRESTTLSAKWSDYVRPARPNDSKIRNYQLAMAGLIVLGALGLSWTIYEHFTAHSDPNKQPKGLLFLTCFIGGFYSLVSASLLHKKLGVIRRTQGAESLRVVGESIEIELDRVNRTFPLRGLTMVVERRDLDRKNPTFGSPHALVLQHGGSEVLVGVGETTDRLQQMLKGLRELQPQLDLPTTN